MSTSSARNQVAASRVVLCSCGLSTDRTLRVALETSDFRVVHCRIVDSLIEEVIRQRPEVVVYELRTDSHSDLAVLQLLRRAAPDVRLVIIAPDGSLRTERMLRELRPVYYAVHPVDADEILDAVYAALGNRNRHGT
jgi:ActR/RegA family two-component response regulator